jgi:phosphoribosylformimino-5-aminoimidazole carboxamide ribonucleotide (ProFAR) isomerase
MPFKGHDGNVSTSGGVVGYIDNWSLSFTGDTAEVNQLGQRAKSFINTTISASGSIGGTLDTADVQQKTLIDMFASGGTLSEVELHLVMKIGGSQDEEFSCQAVLTGIEVGAAHGDKVTFSANFQSTGEVSHSVFAE